jgi:malonate transporter
MEVAGLILPVFAVIVTGWAAGFAGYVPRDLSDGLIHFAYNVAMPALLILTIAQEPARALLAWRFLIAFGGGSLVCFALVFLAARILGDKGVAGPSMQGWAASMTNTGFVALADFAGDLWTAGVAAGGDCNGLCRGCDVSFRSGSAGA